MRWLWRAAGSSKVPSQNMLYQRQRSKGQEPHQWAWRSFLSLCKWAHSKCSFEKWSWRAKTHSWIPQDRFYGLLAELDPSPGYEFHLSKDDLHYFKYEYRFLMRRASSSSQCWTPMLVVRHLLRLRLAALSQGWEMLCQTDKIIDWSRTCLHPDSVCRRNPLFLI